MVLYVPKRYVIYKFAFIKTGCVRKSFWTVSVDFDVSFVAVAKFSIFIMQKRIVQLFACIK
jgi:hypothetical protein